jgi:hypothetical protein
MSMVACICDPMTKVNHNNFFITLIILGSIFALNNSFASNDPFENITTTLEKSGLKITEKPTIYEGDKLFEFIDGGADIYLEYGFKKVITFRVSYSDKPFIITVYEMTSSKSSFGILTFSQHEGMKKVEGMVYARSSDSSLIMSIGKYFCQIQSETFDQVPQKQLTDIAKALVKVLPEEKLDVKFNDYIPKKNRVDFSGKCLFGPIGLKSALYICDENIFHLTPDKPGYFAKYDFDGKDLYLLVIPTNEDAGKKLVEAVNQKLAVKYKESSKINGFKSFVDEKKRIYLADYKDGKFILFYRTKAKKEVAKFQIN